MNSQPARPPCTTDMLVVPPSTGLSLPPWVLIEQWQGFP